MSQNPFVGLRPFESEDSLYYFGRDEQVKALLRQLHETRFLAVVGSSGSGKSSLVRAGLIPHLEAGFLVQDRDLWRIAKMKPGDAPLENLAQALVAAVGKSVAGDLAALLRSQGAKAALDFLQPAVADADANLLLLVDQFEEIFRYCMSTKDSHRQEEARSFVALLLRLAEQTELPVFVCLTMRSDFFGDCDVFYALPEAMNRSQYLVPRLTRSQRREAIANPIRLTGAEISARLLDRLLNENVDTRDDLPVLQHAMMRTWAEWAKAPNGAIDVSHYEKIGAIQSALSQHANEALAELTEAQQATAKIFFQTITETDAGNRRIRRPCHLSEIASISGAAPEALLEIIQKFRAGGRSFLVLSSENPADDPLVDISHESLIRQWETLRTWVDEEAESAKTYRRLAESAELYEKSKAGLYRDADLQVALEWREKQKPTPMWAGRYHPRLDVTLSFLAASCTAQDADIQEQRSRQEEWESLVRERAKSIAREARQQQKILRQTRIFLAVLSVIFLLTFGFGFYAFRQKQIAEQNKGAAEMQSEVVKKAIARAQEQLANAEKQKILTKKEKERADQERDLAKQQKNEAVRLKAEADIRAKYAEEQKQIAETEKFMAGVYQLEAKQKTYDANYNLTRVYEERALKTLEQVLKPSRSDLYQQVWLYTAATLQKEIEPNRFALASSSSDLLFNQDVIQKAFAEIWFSPTVRCRQGAMMTTAFSPDGAILASTSFDGDLGTIYLWNTMNGMLQRELKVSGHVLSVAFSPNGKLLASALSDGTVRLWNVASGQSQGELRSRPRAVLSVAFNPDGKILAGGFADGIIRLWDVAGAQPWREFKLPSGTVWSVAFSPDGTQLATASSDGIIRLWNVFTGEVWRQLKGHSRAVLSVTFSSNGKTLASASSDSTLRLWNIASGVSEAKLRGHLNTIWSVAFSPDNKMLASASDDQTIRLWNVPSGKPLYILKGHTGAVWSVKFSPDSKMLASVSDDGTSRLWSVAESKTWRELKGHTGAVLSVAFSPDGKMLASASSDQTVRLWDVANGDSQRELKGHLAAVSSVSFSSNGKTLASASADGTIRLWDVASGEPKHVLRGHSSTVSSVAFSRDGKILASGSNDHSLRLWKVATGEFLRELKHLNWVRSVAFSPDGKTLASASDDQTVRLWGVPDGKLQQELTAHSSYILCVDFSGDSKTLASASADGTILLWNVASVEFQRTLTGHSNWVRSVEFTEHGKILASASDDQTIRLWDVVSGESPLELRGHSGAIYSIAFSPDGKMLASASDDRTIRLWDLKFNGIYFSYHKNWQLWQNFSEAIQFLWGLKLVNLEIQPAPRVPTLYDHDGYYFVYDKKFRPLLNPPAPGQTKFEQVFEWAKEQAEKNK